MMPCAALLLACGSPGATSRTDVGDLEDAAADSGASDTGGMDAAPSDTGRADAAEDTGTQPDGGVDAPETDAGADTGEADMGTPDVGASCRHTTAGGLYGHLACSTGFQCCDGTWRSRDAGCGECICVEPSGAVGCGTVPVPPGDGPHAGLAQEGSEIPRRGLRNDTGGVGTEPEGVVVNVDGQEWVRGTISQFGGPRDTGVSPTETGAITGERLRSLNDPLDASRSVIESRPEDFYYAAMRYSYSPGDRSFWRDARLLIRNPATGDQVVVRPVDWGPHTRTRRIIDVAPQTERDLGASTDDEVDVAFARPGTPLGPVE